MDKKHRVNILKSFNNAIEGLISAIRTERHMKMHTVITVIVLLLALFLRLNTLDLCLLTLAVGIVWITELLNTAVEHMVDLLKPDIHPLAKKAKDVAAASVFISAITAGIVGYLIFVKHLKSSGIIVLRSIKASNLNIIVFIFVLIAVLVIILKALNKKGSPLEGGMPSGHSALAFSAFMIVYFLIDNPVVHLLCFFMALLVAQTRVILKIHKTKEVVVGAVIGGGITYLIMFMLSKI